MHSHNYQTCTAYSENGIFSYIKLSSDLNNVRKQTRHKIVTPKPYNIPSLVLKLNIVMILEKYPNNSTNPAIYKQKLKEFSDAQTLH